MIKRENKTQPFPKLSRLSLREPGYLYQPDQRARRAMAPFCLVAALGSILAMTLAPAAHADKTTPTKKQDPILKAPASASNSPGLVSKSASLASKSPSSNSPDSSSQLTAPERKNQVSSTRPEAKQAIEAVKNNKADAAAKSGQPAKQTQAKPDLAIKTEKATKPEQTAKSGQFSKGPKNFRVTKSLPANSSLVPPPPPTTPSFMVDPSMISLYGLAMPIDSLSREALKDREKEISVQFKDASAELEAKKRKHNERQERAENFKELYKEGVVSRREMEAAETEASEFAGEVERLDSKTKELKNLLDRIKQRLSPPTKPVPRKLIH